MNRTADVGKRLNADGFEALVSEVLSELPVEFLGQLGNVAITVADSPSPRDLQRTELPPGAQMYGLYEGIPLTKGSSRQGPIAPHRITLFRLPLLAACRTADALRRQVRRTLLHEIGHHFGFDETHIREMGY